MAPHDGIAPLSWASRSEVLRATRLAKSYGGHMVLKRGSFSIHRGEVVAVIGENGAGKSTFAKIVAGVVHPDSGEMHIQGQPVDFQSPRDALRVGISYIPQELAYLSNRTVADNILIGCLPHRAGMTSDATIASTAAAEAKKFGIDLHVSGRMAALTLAERRLGEIVKALTRSSQGLVLDCPTRSWASGHSRKLSVSRSRPATTCCIVFFI